MAEEYVIPPGQEDVIGAMLAKDGGLPGNCRLTTGNVEKTVIKATYTCPGGDVVVDLTHPSAAPGGATRTEKFAVSVESGTPPPDLQSALVARIRERETDFRWLVPPKPPAAAKPGTTGPGLAGPLILVVLLLAAWWLWRRRRAAPR